MRDRLHLSTIYQPWYCHSFSRGNFMHASALMSTVLATLCIFYHWRAVARWSKWLYPELEAIPRYIQHRLSWWCQNTPFSTPRFEIEKEYFETKQFQKNKSISAPNFPQKMSDIKHIFKMTKIITMRRIYAVIHGWLVPNPTLANNLHISNLFSEPFQWPVWKFSCTWDVPVRFLPLYHKRKVCFSLIPPMQQQQQQLKNRLNHDRRQIKCKIYGNSNVSYR